MALMAHDTTKFDGVMRACEDAGNKPDFAVHLNRNKPMDESLGLTALAALVYIGLLKAAVHHIERHAMCSTADMAWRGK